MHWQQIFLSFNQISTYLKQVTICQCDAQNCQKIAFSIESCIFARLFDYLFLNEMVFKPDLFLITVMKNFDPQFIFVVSMFIYSDIHTVS